MYLYKNSTFEDFDESQGIIKGYGSIFGNVDSDGDVITKGAYTKTLSENRDRVTYLYQHNISRPIGKMQELEEDSKGLRFVAKLALDNRDAQDAFALMKAGILRENSVGILPTRKQQKDGYRELTEVKLYEISAVTIAANDQALIDSVKGSEELNDQIGKRYDALIKLIRKGDISDTLGYSIEAELQSLKALHVTTPSSDTLPTLADSEAMNYLLENI